jgi:hypothetical protein
MIMVSAVFNFLVLNFLSRHPQEIHLNLDYKLDESYTPSKIIVRAGTGCHDLKASGQGAIDPLLLRGPAACCELPAATAVALLISSDRAYVQRVATATPRPKPVLN